MEGAHHVLVELVVDGEVDARLASHGRVDHGEQGARALDDGDPALVARGDEPRDVPHDPASECDDGIDAGETEPGGFDEQRLDRLDVLDRFGRGDRADVGHEPFLAQIVDELILEPIGDARVADDQDTGGLGAQEGACVGCDGTECASSDADFVGVGRESVQKYMDGIREQAKTNGYVETLFGRRLYLPEINSRNVPRRQGAERTAINAPMQGSAADIIKKAMINVDQWITSEKLETRIIMQVHDELVFEVPDQELDLITNSVTNLMQNAAELKVPLLVDIGVGDNWDQAH